MDIAHFSLYCIVCFVICRRQLQFVVELLSYIVGELAALSKTSHSSLWGFNVKQIIDNVFRKITWATLTLYHCKSAVLICFLLFKEVLLLLIWHFQFGIIYSVCLVSYTLSFFIMIVICYINITSSDTMLLMETLSPPSSSHHLDTTFY